jgi:hypothetical protein
MGTFTRPTDKIIQNKFEGFIKMATGTDEDAAIATQKQLTDSYNEEIPAFAPQFSFNF